MLRSLERTDIMSFIVILHKVVEEDCAKEHKFTVAKKKDLQQKTLEIAF